MNDTVGAIAPPVKGEPEKADLAPGKGFYAMIDTERMCGHADLTGLNTKGGVSLYAFFRQMFTGKLGTSSPLTDDTHANTSDGLAVPATGSTDNAGVKVAYIHVQYVKMLSLSSAGVQVEE